MKLFAPEFGVHGASTKDIEKDKDSGNEPPAGVNTDSADLSEANKYCSGCGEDLRHIGEEVSERYEYIPAQMLYVEDACQKYAGSCTVRTAATPVQPTLKSTAGRVCWLA